MANILAKNAENKQKFPTKFFFPTKRSFVLRKTRAATHQKPSLPPNMKNARLLLLRPQFVKKVNQIIKDMNSLKHFLKIKHLQKGSDLAFYSLFPSVGVKKSARNTVVLR